MYYFFLSGNKFRNNKGNKPIILVIIINIGKFVKSFSVIPASFVPIPPNIELNVPDKLFIDIIVA